MNSLYRHFDASGELLYVGISLNAIHRLYQHGLASDWFSRISSVKIEHFPTREAAVEAEKKAIIEEKPSCNTVYSTLNKRGGVSQKTIDRIERSRIDLVERISGFRENYSVNDVASILMTSPAFIESEIEKGRISFINMPGKKSGMWPVKIHKRITGWQLIDYMEMLMAESKQQLTP